MANASLFKARTLVKNTDAINEAGGISYKMQPQAALSQLAATGCLNQTFYADAETQLQEVLDLCKGLSSEFVGKVAIFARERACMKDMPALLTAFLTTRKDALPVLSKVFARVIDNGKMLRNFIQIMRSGVVGRKSLGSAPKRLVRQWFESRTATEIFTQSVGNNPSFADILRIIHPKPDNKSKEALYGWMLDREHNRDVLPELLIRFEEFKQSKEGKPPAVPFEMLTALELTTDNWCEIARNARWQWTRMNLNTMARHGVLDNKEMVSLVAERLTSRQDIEKARAFPYQLLAAFKNCGSEIPQKIKNALQDALEIATENVPTFGGKVYVLVDVSGSMGGPVTGYRKGSTTNVSCVDVAALISSVVLRKNDEAEVIPFSDRVKPLTLNPRDSVMTNAQTITRILGGGTNCSAPLAMLNERKQHGDLVLLVSDNQSWVDTYGYGRGNPTRLMTEWDQFRSRSPRAKLVCLDLQPNTTLQAHDRRDILNVGGMSDQVFSIVSMFARNELDSGHWTRVIENIII